MSETTDATVNNASNEFVFIWKIANLRFMSKHKDTFLKSPEFSARFSKETKWYLSLYPNHVDTEYVGFFLNRGHDLYSRGITVNFKLEIAAKNYEKKSPIEKRIFKKNESQGCGFSKFVLYNEIFPSEDILKTNYTLTLQCRMWLHEDETKLRESVSTASLFSNILGENVRDQFGGLPEASNSAEIGEIQNIEQKITRKSHRCVVASYIEIERIELDCSVEDFTGLKVNLKNCIIVKDARQTLNCAALVWSLNSERNLEVSVHINMHMKYQTLNCSLAVLDCTGHAEVQLFEYLDIARSATKMLVFSNVISFDDVISKRDTLLCNGSLVLKFHMIFSNESVRHVLMSRTSTGVEKTKNNPAMSDLALAMKDFYLDHKHCDAILCLGTTDLPVHKVVVCARSPVLDALFSSDMKEKATGVVEVTDVDMPTMKRMLLYMYTDVLEDMNDEECMSLYSACDKYGFMPLMNQCAVLLVENLTLKNACSVLVLADTHNDIKLGEAVLNFACENSSDFFSSDDWKDVVKNNAELACKVFQMVLSRIM